MSKLEDLVTRTEQIYVSTTMKAKGEVWDSVMLA